MISSSQSLTLGKMNTTTTKQGYIDWYVAEFKHPHISVDRLTEEAGVMYQCLKRREEFDAEREKLEALREDYLKGVESLAKLRVMDEAYKLLS